MNFRRLFVPLVLASGLSLQGCKPDELEITVYSSDIETAAKGEVIDAPAVVRFSMVGNDERGELLQARDLARRWLPADSKIEVSKTQLGDSLIVETKIPVVSVSKAKQVVQAQRPLFFIEVDGAQATLRGTTHLEAFNRELRNINSMLGASLPARSTVIALVGDKVQKNQRVEATAVFVNNRAVLNLKEPLVNRKTMNIRFSGQDGSVYQDFERIPPSLRLRID
jgi:hypothetical protein